MLGKLETLQKSGLSAIISGTVLVTIGFFISNICSYILQVLLARSLTLADYGTFTAILSLAYIFGFPNTVFSTSLIKLVSELKASADFKKLTTLFLKFSVFSVIYGIVLVFVLIIFDSFLAGYLKIAEIYLFKIFGLYMAASFLVTVPSAYLQGLLRFKAFTFFTVLGSILRIVFPLLLIFLGYRVFGVLAGLFLTQLVSFAVALLLLKKNFAKGSAENLSASYKKLLKFSTPVLLINVGLVLLSNIDVLLVKHYFDAQTTGIYAGVVTVGKILLFGTGTVGVIMYPQISEIYAKGESFHSKFKQFLGLQLALVSIGTLFFMVFPKLITLIMFGSKFASSVELIPRFAIFIGLYVLINFLILFFLAIEKTSVYVCILPAVVVQAILINLFHGSLVQIINVNIISSLILLLAIVIYYRVNVNIRNSPSI